MKELKSRPLVKSAFYWARQAHRLALAAGCVATTLGCSSTRPTEIVAGVSTQIRVPDGLSAIGLSVQLGGTVKYCEHFPVTDNVATLPGSLGLLGETGLAEHGAVTVQVIGFRTPDSKFSEDCVNTRAEDGELDTMVIRRRRLSFVDDQIKFLPLPLKESCADELGCKEDQTCIGGKCVSADIDATTLANYNDSLLFGDSNTCFDASRCMDGLSVPVQLEDKDTCTFRALWPEGAPRPSKDGLNVRLFYKSFGSEILDLDATSAKPDQREGFSFMGDGSDPLTFRLAPNLCESNYNTDLPNVLAIDASAMCSAKRALQPICTGYTAPDLQADIRPGGGAPGSDPGPGICTLAGLEPVESVVYVLMDHSLSMDKFFGDGGLAFAIGIPLSSPVAKRTKVAFDFLPPEADQCGTDAYAKPLVPFGAVEDTRLPIGAILGGDSSVLPDDPPQFFLGAALQGAYQGVSAIEAADPALGFNRRAVVVISNRDISAGACPGPEAAALAKSAHDAVDNRVFTYAVALDSGEPGALESASELADAGGTTVFNGVTDEAEGARAVNDILTELGTCLYKVRRADADKAARLPPEANISYIDPVAPTVSVNIPFNSRCQADAASTVSGWNQEDNGLVRLCGSACENLRGVIGDVSVFHAAQGRVPPAVPLVATASCDKFVRQTK
jgi:hypothetical protein